MNVSIFPCRNVECERSVLARCLDCSMVMMQQLAGNGYELVIEWLLTHRCRDTEACPPPSLSEDANNLEDAAE